MCSAGSFTWPVGVSTNGPYTLLSGLQTNLVFTPTADWSTENDLKSHKYNHHTRIAYLGSTIFVAHSSAGTNEADSGQQTVVQFSRDYGTNWSDPVLVCPAQSTWKAVPFENGARISYPRNFQILSNALYLVSAIDQCDTSGGEHYIGIALVACRLFEDGTLGPLFRISTADYTPLSGKPYIAYDSDLGPPLYSYSKIYGTWGGTWASAPDSDWHWKYVTNGPGFSITVSEPNTFSVDGSANNLTRLWRNADFPDYWFVWQADSTDGGLSWTKPQATTVPNGATEITGMSLNDLRYVIISNPAHSGRDPLYLAITAPASMDITTVGAIQQGVSSVPVYASATKTGGAAYPSVVQKANYLYVAYSIHKESIGFSRILIPGRNGNDNDKIKHSWISSFRTLTLKGK